MIVIKNVKNMDLENTITCGQIFRFIKEIDNSFTVILCDRVVNLKYINGELYVDSNNEDNLEIVIRNYLDLDRDYLSIINDIKKIDSNLKPILNNSIGLKFIKQEPLECIVSYVISQNNSVRNIQNSLNLISFNYGEKVIFNNKEYYLFPTLDKLSKINSEEFRECKVGFRDKYLVDIISAINTDMLDINKMYDMDSEYALEYLMGFKGIGMKVASCILLFGYHKFDVYPVDTWVKKFMFDNYNIFGEENIRKYCKEKFGIYSGLVIQYMFNSKRNM
ncbi:MAG: hypothetical protein IJD92_00390 [Bacilli bacterium]|nr:hypothetical protein [Bacilli bacterium]